MKDKVELDVLEIGEPGIIDVPKDGEDGENPVPQETTDEPKGKGFLKIAALIVLVLALSAALLLWLYSGGEKGEEAREKHQAGSAAPAGYFVPLEKFAVNIKDGQGNYRVLVFDITLEMSRDGLASDRVPELRKIVYKTIRDNSALALKAPQSMKQLAKEIEKGVNGALGEGTVRQAFMTKFTLL